MKALVVGLGSMGKRRIRNLKALGVEDIWGVDSRTDRREEASAKYGIVTQDKLEVAILGLDPDAIIISTPPDKHFEPAAMAVEHNIPCFIEASVISSDVAKLLEHCEGGSLIAPSCTMRYFEGPKKVNEFIVAELIASGISARPLNINYHVGQYLPDWHPWEDIKDFYVGKRETGGCREILPFELTWLNDIFGDPEPLACVKSRVSDLPVDIDDVYHCVLRYPRNLLANITIDVISRPQATRHLCVLGDCWKLVWDGSKGHVRYSNTGGVDEQVELFASSPEPGYINPEKPYVDELRDFLDAVRRNDRELFPNTLADDYKVLRVLDRLESLA